MSETEKKLKAIRALLEKLVDGQDRMSRMTRGLMSEGVPREGYRDELHRGEVVLTRPAGQIL